MRRSRSLLLALVALMALPAGRGRTAGNTAPPPPPNPKSIVAPTMGSGQFTPEELKALDEVEKDEQNYERQAHEQQHRLNEIVARERRQRLHDINERYKKGCLSANEDYQKRHLDAIKLLKAFIDKYPDDPKWTPDVMFRLAQLYIDQAGMDYAVSQGNKPCSELDEKPVVTAPLQTETPDGGAGTTVAANGVNGPDYTAAIDLMTRIVEKFPEYRLIDLTLYSLAFYQGEEGMGNIDQAKQAYQALVCFNKYGPNGTEAGHFGNPPESEDPKAPCEAVKVVDDAGQPVTLPDRYDGCEPSRDGSTLLDEGWVRLGDSHFFARCEMPAAIAAYKRVATNEKSDYFLSALYRLGWSYFRVNHYPEALAAFDKTVVISDKEEDQNGNGEKFDLRQEAVQYIAVSLSDPWPSEKEVVGNPTRALERADAMYLKTNRLSERHVRDVYETLGDTIRQEAGTPGVEGVQLPPDTETAYRSAIKAWQFALDNWKLYPRNPEIQEKIVDLLQLLGDKNAELEARQKLANDYKKGSDWYRANEMNREAMELANRLGEHSLIDAAFANLRKAQEARKAWEEMIKSHLHDVVAAELGAPKKRVKEAEINAKVEERLQAEIYKQQDDPGRVAYKKLYADAADMIESYLTTYPTSTQVPELVYRRADALYFSDQFDPAVEQYRWVRDHKSLVSSKIWEEATRSIVLSRETARDLAVSKDPKLEPADPTADVLKAKPEPVPIPPIFANVQAAYDEFSKYALKNKLDNPLAGHYALASAIVYWKFVHLDEAATGFEGILKDYCHTPEAVIALSGLQSIYDARNQNDAYLKVNEDFIAQKCGSAEAIAEAEAKIGDKRFNIANDELHDARALKKAGKDAEAQAKYLAAGQDFYTLYKGMQDADPHLAEAIYFSATAYTEGGRPKTGIALYQVILDDKRFRQSPYYVEAIFYVAVAYEAAFDVAKAGDLYLQFFKVASTPGVNYRHPDPKNNDPGFDIDGRKLDAQFNAAYMRELDRQYDDRSGTDLGAITLYKRYAAADRAHPDKAGKAFLRIVGIYEKTGKTDAMIAAYGEWRKEYANGQLTGDVAVEYVKSFYKTAAAQKRPADGYDWWAKTIAAFEHAYGPLPASNNQAAIAAYMKKVPITAREFAAEAAFHLADKYYKEKILPYKFGFKCPVLDVAHLTDAKAQQNAIAKCQEPPFDAAIALLKPAYAQFGDIAMYTTEWTLAAYVRMGDASYLVGQQIIGVKTPPEVTKLDKKLQDAGVDVPFADNWRRQIECRSTTGYVDPDNRSVATECECLHLYPADPDAHDKCVDAFNGGGQVCVAPGPNNTCTRQIDQCQLLYGPDGKTCEDDDGVCSKAKGMDLQNCTNSLTDDARNPYGAKTMWKTAVDLSKDLGISNEYTKAAEAHLNELDSDKFKVQRDNLIKSETAP